MDAAAVVHVGAGDALDGRTTVPLARDGGEMIWSALNGGALHVAQDAAHTTQLFAAAGATRSAVD